MGQSASSQRQREELPRRDPRRFSQLVHEQEGSRDQAEAQSTSTRQSIHAHTLSTSSPGHSDPAESLQSTPFATFSRQISAQSIPASGSLAPTGNPTARDSIFYEQHEERPLVNMEDLGMRDAPITHITATPLPRRTSVLSRLGTRLLPRSNSRQTAEQMDIGNASSTLRRRLSRSLPTRYTQGQTTANHHRLSILGSISPGSHTLPRSRRRRGLASISQPYPITAEPSVYAHGDRSPENPPRSETSGSPTPLVGRERRSLASRESRFSRIRRSLSIPLESLLATSRSPSPEDGETPAPLQRLPQDTPSPVPDFQIPPLPVAEPQLDFQSSQIASMPPPARDDGAQGFQHVAETADSTSTRAEGSSWTERWADRTIGARRESRRMPSMLRGRSSRLIRRDDDGPLPRILHLAAAAIAAQLSGAPEQAFNNTQAIGAEGLDGSLANLFRTLQLATASTTEYHSPNGGSDPPRPGGAAGPLNFLRVFRFVGNGAAESANGAGTGTPASGEDDPASGDGLEASEGRFVTLVMVGVRSVPSDHIGEDALNAPTLDALLSIPTGPSNDFLRSGSRGLLRHADGRPRFPRRRRASMGGVNPFPANYDSQRHQRMRSSSRQGSTDATSVVSSSLPMALSESPPGPHPPPSTPADPGLSTYSSGTTTPNRRPSSASALQHPSLPSRDLAAQHLREAGILTPEDQALRAVQQRRRSDSEFARQRDFGAGAARRNGVVEPDEVEMDDAPTQGSRSWLIYVVGTNLSEDHPAFATPSLFTDNPTYEDMMLLSSLLGPAKPPVASREDVASAPGVYIIREIAGTLIATTAAGNDGLQIASGERCLVCLCDYEPGEEVRQLSKCTHVFHRQCIDEWLTTGRNSCPLCRGQGVDEKSSGQPGTSQPRPRPRSHAAPSSAL